MTRGTPPYMVTAGTEESANHESLKSAVEAASDMDEDGAQDPIQVVDSKGEIVLYGGELTDQIMDYRISKRGTHATR
jgi:hypothetical protein